VVSQSDQIILEDVRYLKMPIETNISKKGGSLTKLDIRLEDVRYLRIPIETKNSTR